MSLNCFPHVSDRNKYKCLKMWIFAILCLIKIFKFEVIVIEETCIDLNRNQPIRRIQNKGNIAELNGVVSSQEECEFLLTIINKNTSIR